jgi:hypothetical protein
VLTPVISTQIAAKERIAAPFQVVPTFALHGLDLGGITYCNRGLTLWSMLSPIGTLARATTSLKALGSKSSAT